MAETGGVMMMMMLLLSRNNFWMIYLIGLSSVELRGLCRVPL